MATVEFIIPGYGAEPDEKVDIPEEYRDHPERYFAIKTFGGFRKLDRQLDEVNRGVATANSTAQKAVGIARESFDKAGQVEAALVACQDKHAGADKAESDAKNGAFRVVQIVTMTIGALAAGAAMVFGVMRMAAMFTGGG